LLLRRGPVARAAHIFVRHRACVPLPHHGESDAVAELSRGPAALSGLRLEPHVRRVDGGLDGVAAGRPRAHPGSSRERVPEGVRHGRRSILRPEMNYMRIAALLCIALATGSTASLAQEGDESSGTAGPQAAPSGQVPSCEEVLRLAPLMTATPVFEGAPLEAKRASLGLWAGCALEARDLAAAYEVLARIAPIAPNPESPYLLLMRLAADLRKGREAVEAFHA